MKLSKDGLLNIMRLTLKGERIDTPAPVSKQVWPLIDAAPTDLIERKQNADGGGTASLTEEGHIVLKWQEYFATLPKHNQP